MSNKNKNIYMGTKAETLFLLSKLGYNIPKVYYFTVNEWKNSKKDILNKILSTFKNTKKVAVRSSSLNEDTDNLSMAGAYKSFLNIKLIENSLIDGIENVISSFDASQKNQVLIQEMVNNVIMSGVVMTKVLDDGSPYYVFNYDDTSGKTDSVTSGNSINKTVYIYNGVTDLDFDSKLLLNVLKLVQSLENTFSDIPIDIEFAVDKNQKIQLLQVRKITTKSNWDKNIHNQISSRFDYLKSFIQNIMKKRINIYGSKTTLGIMPDWNPAEMIGVVPQPLASSLYRELITKRVWSRAREVMGYRKMPNIDLMISLYGRPYIDVRNSLNSFLPAGLKNEISEKIVNAYINRLDNDPHLHDKLEFEVVLTSYDFQIDEKLKMWYENILTSAEEDEYKGLLRELTINAINKNENNTLDKALSDIEYLKTIQNDIEKIHNYEIMFIIDKIKTLLEECKQYGTLPFSIIARHAFIAESLLRSLVDCRVIEKERIALFKKSFSTIAGEMSSHLYQLNSGEINKETGFVMDLKVLKELIKEHVEEALDHKNLNLDVPEFKNLNPTAENIAVVIWNKLRPHIQQTKELEVVLYETPRNFVTYTG